MNYLPLNDQTEAMAHRANEPSACGICGIPQRSHFRQWKQGIGWHTWVMPSDEQIKSRMIFRRNQR